MRCRVTCLEWRPSMSTPAPRRPAVLVVEDELLLRIDAVEMIEDAGFEALEAADADEAIEILEGRPDTKAPIKIIATSGRVNIRIDDLPEGGRFLPKPYLPEEIAGTLRELVGA